MFSCGCGAGSRLKKDILCDLREKLDGHIDFTSDWQYLEMKGNLGENKF